MCLSSERDSRKVKDRSKSYFHDCFDLCIEDNSQISRKTSINLENFIVFKAGLTWVKGPACKRDRTGGLPHVINMQKRFLDC